MRILPFVMTQLITFYVYSMDGLSEKGNSTLKEQALNPVKAS